MVDRSNAEAVLVTGAFGTGKTSAIEEIADILEARGVRYGAIDLDWLSWFDPASGGDHRAGVPVMLKNVDAVVGNYYDTGVRRFALARTMETPARGGRSADRARDAAHGGPAHAPLRRDRTPALRIGDGWDGRTTWPKLNGRSPKVTVTPSVDLTFDNVGPIRDVALRIVNALGW